MARHAWRGIDDLCLYVHVPFCETRCSFCEYTVVKRDEIPGMGPYVDDLIQEFELYREALDTGSRTPPRVRHRRRHAVLPSRR